MSETRIEMTDTAGFWGQIAIKREADGRWSLDVDDRRGRGRCLLTDAQFDRLAWSNPRVRDLLSAALDCLATGVLAAHLDDAVAPFLALNDETDPAKLPKGHPRPVSAG